MSRHSLKIHAFILAAILGFPGPAFTEEVTVPDELKVCITCHSGTTEIGQQILSAKSGYMASVHFNGQRVPIIDSAADEVAGYYWGGSHAFMGNGSSCQVCHTNEGFLNKIAGKYDGPADVAGEVIMHPSPPGCFTCHNPHEESDFTKLNVPDGTPVANGVHAIYDKPEGSICASCHHVRLMNGRVATFDTVGERILDGLKEPAPLSRHYGPHYGGETDVLLGANGAEYAGQDYTRSSAHSVDPKANCTSCHMPMRSDMMSHLSSALTGHSFEITGTVGDRMRANLGGCEGCHNIVKRVLTTAPVLDQSEGYLVKGTLYFQDWKDWEASTPELQVKLDAPKEPARMVSDILVKLADPDNGCTGLLAAAYDKVAGTEHGIHWANTSFERCHIEGYARTPLPAATSEANASARILKALWNFQLITTGDGSMGAHNLNYTLQLLYDSCTDLHALVDDGTALATACNDPAANRP